jgi:transposase
MLENIVPELIGLTDFYLRITPVAATEDFWAWLEVEHRVRPDLASPFCCLKRRRRRLNGVGPITALNWALEMGDISRFRSIKQAVSYCGLCGDERSSADKVMRMPLSKQRNKHIQHVLVEAAKLAPRQSAELALIHQKAIENGNRNRATLAVARKMVAWLLAVDRENREFIPEQREIRAA